MKPDPSFITEVPRMAEEAPSLLERALRGGGRYADLFYEWTLHHQLSLRQEASRNTVHPPRQTVDRRKVEGVGIRVLGKKQGGFAATDVLTPQALRAAAETAAAPPGETRLPPSAITPMAPSMHLALPDDAPHAITASEKSALLRQAAEAAFALDTGTRRVHAAYQDRVRCVLIATSEGTLRTEATMLLGLRVDVTLAIGGREVTAHAVAGGAFGFGHFFAHPPEHVAQEAVERARVLADAKPLPPGPMPVVLAGGWSGVWLHESLGHLLEADVVTAGFSPFADRRGTAIAPPAVTLVDDATLPGGRGTHTFDDEGTPTGRTVLVEAGVLRSFLTDRRTAHALDLPRTGNARRQDYRHAPLPRMSNLLLLGGEADPADLLADVSEGLYVKVVGQGSVRPDRDITFDVVEGYRIERGRRTTPVTGLSIVGGGPEALRRIAGVGHDLRVDHARGLCLKARQVVPVSVGMPTVLIDEMQVVENH
ncbi:MAG: TldD/PmbA family protein [Rhodothermales bacterium]